MAGVKPMQARSEPNAYFVNAHHNMLRRMIAISSLRRISARPLVKCFKMPLFGDASFSAAKFGQWSSSSRPSRCLLPHCQSAKIPKIIRKLMHGMRHRPPTIFSQVSEAGLCTISTLVDAAELATNTPMSRKANGTSIGLHYIADDR